MTSSLFQSLPDEVTTDSRTIQFPEGQGNTQGSYAIEVSSTTGLAYIAGISPSQGSAPANLQNYVLDLDTGFAPDGTFLSLDTRSSQDEGRLPDDQPQAIGVFDDGD